MLDFLKFLGTFLGCIGAVIIAWFVHPVLGIIVSFLALGALNGLLTPD